MSPGFCIDLHFNHSEGEAAAAPGCREVFFQSWLVVFVYKGNFAALDVKRFRPPAVISSPPVIIDVGYNLC